MTGREILLGVSGGIAAYKSADLCSKLVQAGASVSVVMTESACAYVQGRVCMRARARVRRACAWHAWTQSTMSLASGTYLCVVRRARA